MPIYALLGATGATGSAILRCLLANPPPDLHLNILIRSKSKLLNLFPSLSNDDTTNTTTITTTTNTPFPITVFEGVPLSNPSLLATALTSAEVIFNCIATNSTHPKTSTMYDISAAIIAALSSLQQKKQSQNRHLSTGYLYTKPTILQLRTASLNTHLTKQVPAAALWMTHFVLYFNYLDHERAMELYSKTLKDEPGLCEVLFVDPPSLHDEDGRTATGHELLFKDGSGENEESKKIQRPEISYADLGAGFVEVAGRVGELRDREVIGGAGMGEGVGEVGVGATGVVQTTWGVLMGYLLLGVRFRVLHALGMV